MYFLLTLGVLFVIPVRSIKTPLDQTHVYSIESKDRLAPFGVTMFLYRTIGDGRNTGVLGVLILTMSSELFYNCKKKFITIRIHFMISINVLFICYG